MSSARVRIYAQVGDSALLHRLADTYVSSHEQISELLCALADEYSQQHGDAAKKLPGIPGP